MRDKCYHCDKEVVFKYEDYDYFAFCLEHFKRFYPENVIEDEYLLIFIGQSEEGKYASLYPSGELTHYSAYLTTIPFVFHNAKGEAGTYMMKLGEITGNKLSPKKITHFFDQSKKQAVEADKEEYQSLVVLWSLQEGKTKV